MRDLSALSNDLRQHLRLQLPPVGVAFRDRPPEGVVHVSAAAPASCSYWRRAADGDAFWTDADDHQGCPIGAHTHGVPIGVEKARELEQMIDGMVQLGYIGAAEVRRIPRRATPFEICVYAPLERMPCEPDLVLVRGTVAQLMVLAEAAQAAGVAPEAPAMGRPTCAALPQASQSSRPVVSLGCIGNRVYTGLEDGEGYAAIPAAALEAVANKLAIVVRANEKLEKFHRGRAGR
jgi:uncharacterized protein (DUF169 family)